MTTRTSSAEWRGDLKSGDGDLELASGAFKGAYTFASRFEEGEGTNPEELAGAAHAACYSMFLANVLTEAGGTVETVRTEAEVHLESVDGAPTITTVALTTRARLSGLDDEAFQEQVEVAKQGCPISKLFTGATITVDAQLEG